jgi:hypothetical protein
MKTGVHINSIQAYHGERLTLSKRASDVLWFVRENGACTDREVMVGMGFTEPNSVRPRITELLEEGLLVDAGNTKCRFTGKTVRRVDIHRPQQRELFS